MTLKFSQLIRYAVIIQFLKRRIIQMAKDSKSGITGISTGIAAGLLAGYLSKKIPTKKHQLKNCFQRKLLSKE